MVPILQALWLLDAVEFDEDTQRVNLRGLFDTLRVPSGTEFVPPMSVYFAVRGVHGEA